MASFQGLRNFVSEAVPDYAIIRGVVYPGHEKAPYTPSGMAFRGCVSYKPKEDRLQCHECGEWFDSLSAHIRGSHKPLSVADYKTKHCLRQSTSLINRRMQSALAAAARPEGQAALRVYRQTPEYKESSRRGGASHPKGRGSRFAYHYEARNEKGTCNAQLVVRIAEVVKEFGITPSIKEFESRGIHLYSILDSFDVKNVAELMDKLGFGRCVNKGNSKPAISDADLLDGLRDFYVRRGRLPGTREFGQGALRARSLYCKRFGSIRSSFALAGLELVASRRDLGPRCSAEEILRRVAAFCAAHDRLPKLKDFGSEALPFSGSVLRNRFGSIALAAEAAGAEVPDLHKPRHGRWNAGSSIPKTAEFIRAKWQEWCDQHGEPPSITAIRGGGLGVCAQTVYKHFGTVRPAELLERISKTLAAA